MFGFYFVYLFQGLYNGDLTANMKAFIFISSIPAFFIIFVFIKHKIYFPNYKIKFTNMFIEFIHNNEMKKSCRIVKMNFEKPFFAFTHDKDYFWKLIFYFYNICIFYLSNR